MIIVTANQAKEITKRNILIKQMMPPLYDKIHKAALDGKFKVDIGTPPAAALAILRADGYTIYCGEDDGDPHSSRCLYYMCSWYPCDSPAAENNKTE
jgi:hypothetical protein